jgi:hypothetical protein
LLRYLDFKDLKAVAVKGVEDEDVESGKYLPTNQIFRLSLRTYAMAVPSNLKLTQLSSSSSKHMKDVTC